MKILPAEGTDVITFGMTRHQVVERLGQPANATRLGDHPGYPRNRESLDYGGLSVLLTPGDGVISIDVDSSVPGVTLWDVEIFERTPDQVVDLIKAKGHRPEASVKDSWDDFDIHVLALGLNFYCSEDGLESVEVSSTISLCS